MLMKMNFLSALVASKQILYSSTLPQEMKDTALYNTNYVVRETEVSKHHIST